MKLSEAEELYEKVEFGDKAPGVVKLSEAEKDFTGDVTFGDEYFNYNRGAVRSAVGGVIDAIDNLGTYTDKLNVFNGMAVMKVGDITGNETTTNVGKEMIKIAQHNIDENEKYMQYASPEELNSFSYNLGGGGVNYGLMFLTGGAASAGAKLLGAGAKAAGTIGELSVFAEMFGMSAGEEAQQRIEKYKQRTGDVELKEYTPEMAGKNLFASAVYATGEAALEKWAFKEQKILFSSPKTILKTGALAALKEGGTEGLQSALDIGIDLADGTLNISELPDALRGMLMEAAIGGTLGFGAGIGVGYVQRNNAIKYLNNNLSNTIPDPQERIKTATEIVDKSISKMQEVIAVEKKYSTEFRDKYGETFDAMKLAASQAMQNSEWYQGLTEDEKANYIMDKASMFADQVAAEANKRNDLIQNVVNAKDIVYDPETKELRLAPKTEASERKRVFQQSQDVAQRINEIDAEEEAKGVATYTQPTININGVERQTTNSNGTPIAKSQRSLEYFYNWFGDSKVVDEQGRPLVVYHGTDERFDRFLYKYIGKHGTAEGSGFYFTNNKSFSEGWGKQKSLYLKIDNPLVLDKGKQNIEITEEKIREVAKKLSDRFLSYESSKIMWDDLTDTIVKANAGRSYFAIESIMNSFESFGDEVSDLSENEFKDGMRKIISETVGVDGYIRQVSNDVTIYVALMSNQIKSIDNRGTFGTDENIYKQGQGKSKGTFDSSSKVIQLFKGADASTLDHELSHYWLDNMWTYANSGMASEVYKAQFQAVKDFLGVRPSQKYLTYNQHEKFATAYEKYIHRGIIPNSMMGNVFDNYERFIRNVYNSIEDIMYTTKKGERKGFNLTPEIIKFFDSMVRGGVDTTMITETVASEARNEEAQKADDTTMKEAKSVIADMPEREVMPEIAPVKVEGKTKESRLYNRLKGVVGDTGAVQYNVVNIEQQREIARKMWQESPEKAQAILNGTEKAEDVLRQAIYTEQQILALENGDTNTFLTSLRKQTAEATRLGQELSALRGVAEDITDPAYWIRSAETEALKNLAKKQTKNLENAKGNSPLVELTSRLDADIKALQKDVASKATNEEKTKAFKEGIKSIAEKYQGLEQPDMVFNQVDWDNEDFANDYIENKVKEKLGIALPKDTAKAFIQTARELDALSKQRDEMGNPVEAFFAKKDELERMRNSHTPTSRTKVLISTIGRSNMLTAPATSVLNVVSNAQNFAAENVVRKVGNFLEGKTNDNIVSKELSDKYRAKAWDVFWKTGYDMSMMSSLLDERLYKGESITHSEGEGAIRAVGRFAEKYVFSRLISTPDMYFKSILGFTNYVGNEATDIAYKEGLTGDKAAARANELFKDAILIEPQTELGKQIREKAKTDALVLTFQQDTLLANTLLKIRDAINKGTGDIGIGDIMSPFIKTPANIISMGFDASIGPFASPVNLLGALTDIKNKNYKSARVLQAARQTTTATLAYTVIALLASMFIDDDDYIPDYAQLTSKERQAVRARGGSFGSIKVGGEYISTDFFGPFEMPLVTFLNSRKTGNILKGIASGSVSKLIDAPVIKDILGSSEAIKDMATSKDDIISAIGENAANAAISRLTPNALNTVAKVIDNKERKMNTVLDKLKARIPFVRETLPERISVATGQPEEMQRINTILLGSRGKYEVSAPLAKEIGRLSDVGEAVSISDPTRSGDLSKLSDAQKSDAQDMFAREYAKKASRLIKMSSYKNKSDEGKKEALDKIRREVVEDIKYKYRKEIKRLKKSK